VIDVNGQLVSYDNRRLDAAREVGDPVRVQQVNPDDAMPESSTGKTWQQMFEKRRNDKRNTALGGCVPEQGLPDRPTVTGNK